MYIGARLAIDYFYAQRTLFTDFPVKRTSLEQSISCSILRRYAPKEHLMHLDGERGEERRQSQHEATDHRRKPGIAAATRANDQRR